MGEAPAVLGGTAIKPVEYHGIEAVKMFFWDPGRRAVMGRTPKSWALIILFYVIYYSCLAAFWALMMFIFLSTIDEHAPKWIGEDSLIGTSPGLGIRPNQPDDTLDSSMIIFNYENKFQSTSVPGTNLWRNQINEFLVQEYRGSTLRPCRNGQPHEDGSPCKFDIERQLGNCSIERGKENNYGYTTGQPCLYFKLNRILNVKNEHYTKEEEFPEDMPEELRRHILRQPFKEQVWINCAGENPADVEAMGPLMYFPSSRGFPSQYFPFNNPPEKNYESPVVAVQFRRPRIGQLLHIECRAWAKNIRYDRMNRIGMVRFELFVLNNAYAEEYQKSM